ncbi:unnamed protein product [Prunus armeniaca]
MVKIQDNGLDILTWPQSQVRSFALGVRFCKDAVFSFKLVCEGLRPTWLDLDLEGRSHGLWDLVEKGLEWSDSKGADDSVEKKNQRELVNLALRLIQGSVSDEIFPRISHEETSKGAWDLLMQEFRGDKQMLNRLKLEIITIGSIRIGNQKARSGITRQVKALKLPASTVLGHIAKDCYSKKTTQQVNYATQVEAAPTMFNASNAIGAGITRDEEVWYLDSGCSNHMTGKEDLLVDIDRNVTGKGTLVVETKVGKRYIKEIMLVPGLKENLLSVGQMIEHGYYLVFGNHKVEIYNDSSLSNLVAKAEIHLAYKASVDHSTELWHRRFGHLNMSSLKLLKEQDMVVGLPEIKGIKEVCEGCVLGKQCREAFPREATTRALTPLELIHSDICGPMQTVTKAGNRFFLTFIDDCTRMCWVYFLRHKSEALTVFKKFKATVELQSGYKLKKLRSDRGGEYTLVEFDSFCEDVGIERQLTTPYTPQQNGVAERKNRTIVEMAKCLMLEKKIPFDFWAEAVNISMYILNRCPTKALSKKTPFEAYSGRKPGVKHLKAFGSLCYAHVPKQQRQKLDLASKRCIFLGYGSCEKGYRLYNIETGKMIVSRDVIFSENVCWDRNANKETGVNIQLTGIREEEQGEEGSSCEFEEQLEVNEVPSLNTENSDQERVTSPQDVDHTPLKYKSIAEIYEKCNMCIIELESFEEAAKDDSWKKAMEDEITMIEKNNTWELVDRPFDKPIIGVKWVYKTKLNLDESVQKNKARLVVFGPKN